MHPISPEILNQGLTYAAYRERIEKNADVFDEVYARPAFEPADLEPLRRIPPQTLVTIGEDWCPDVYHTLPTWVRVAEALEGWRCLIYERDRHQDLMQAFLYQGKAMRVPVYAFYDGRGFLQTWWSGRSAAAQAAWDGYLAGRVFAELDEPAKMGARKVLNDGYRERFRRLNFEEILRQLKAFWHLA